MGGADACDEQAARECLCDLLLRFPCAAHQGVRWSALQRAFRDRTPEAARSYADEAARGWLADLVEVVPGEEHAQGGGSGQDPLLRLRDEALAQGRSGQLACWPLLVQRLGDIVRSHGTAIDASALGEGAAEQVEGAPGDGSEVVGVLLSQLKPLLRRHWDPGFEEANGFFNEAGCHVAVKKMKHLVAELLRWRERRRSLGLSSAVDAALEAPLVLATSLRHNDMVLCCPARPCARSPGAAPPRPPLTAASSSSSPQKAAAAIAPDAPSPTKTDGQRADASEKECQRLRIENAELKKRLRFDGEFLHKQIRRLRIENAELKKRLFFPYHHATGHSTPPTLPLQPIWVVATPTGGTSAQAPSAPRRCADSPAQQLSSGQGSPACGSLTPIPQGAVCYAVPLAQGMVSAQGVSAGTPPWSGTMMPPMMAAMMPMTGTPPCMRGGEVLSPTYSDASGQMHLLPRSLLGSADTSGQVSDVVSPQRGAHVVAAQHQRPDDRWVCIPSGIVERHKAQFEGPGGAAADQERRGATGAGRSAAGFEEAGRGSRQRARSL